MKVKQEKGNYVSEWFGHRVYPFVMTDEHALREQQNEICPFLSVAKGESQKCIKSATSKGVCTISTLADGVRHDWLVCPYRALEPSLLEKSIRRLFGIDGRIEALVMPAIQLAKPEPRKSIEEQLSRGGRAFIYFDEKVGGELGIPSTSRSPEFSFDVTVIEIEKKNNLPHIGRFGVIEIQTMDFHGSYRTAVENLKQTLRMFPRTFSQTLEKNKRLLAEGIEGPNIANVFKRTFYQMMFKFQLGQHEQCAGCVLAIPASVWNSWQRHLGAPDLKQREDGTYDLFKSGIQRPVHIPAWIYVFAVESESEVTPAPLVDDKIIATDSASIAHFALDVAPAEALSNIDSDKGMMSLLLRRMNKIWPELARTLSIERAGTSPIDQ